MLLKLYGEASSLTMLNTVLSEHLVRCALATALAAAAVGGANQHLEPAEVVGQLPAAGLGRTGR